MNRKERKYFIIPIMKLRMEKRNMNVKEKRTFNNHLYLIGTFFYTQKSIGGMMHVYLDMSILLGTRPRFDGS